MTETEMSPSMSTELSDSTFNSLGDNSLDPEIFEDLDDLGPDNFLSYDPLHKWETLDSLVDSKPCHDSLLDNTEFIESSLTESSTNLKDTVEDVEGTDVVVSNAKCERLQRSISINPTVTEKNRSFNTSKMHHPTLKSF